MVGGNRHSCSREHFRLCIKPSMEKGQAYLVEKFVETWLFYEPTLIILSQAFPMPYAAAIALGLDIARRAITRLKKISLFTKSQPVNVAAT